MWWRRGDSNPRPLQCDCSALPTELRPRKQATMRVYPAAQLRVNFGQMAPGARSASIFNGNPEL
jgi:hypothetical protein